MVTEKSMSEGLKQKIQKLYDEELADLRKAGTPLDVEVSSGRMELLGKVLGLLDEATKQIQTMKEFRHPILTFIEYVPTVGECILSDYFYSFPLEHTHPHPEFWKGWNKAIDEISAVLDGKEKARA